MKKRVLSLLLTMVMVLSLLPVNAMAAGSAAWAGAANYNDDNNQVTTTALPDSPAYTAEKWAYGLNTTINNYGSYYAGQTVIVDGYLYATGGGKLHKVDIATGVGTTFEAAAGATSGSYYDYLCYADGVLLVSTQTKLEAFDLNGTSLGSVEGSYSYYHPMQYHNGYVICNGYIYKLDKSGSAVTFTPVGEGPIGGAAFNWSSGAFVNNKFYVVGATTVYAVDHTTGTVTDSYVFDADRTASNKSTQGGASYDAATGRLFWGTYSYNTKVHSIKINEDGTLDKGSYLSGDASQKTVCTPVISGGRVYLAGQSGNIDVLNAADLTLVYGVATGGGKIQSTPIVSTAGGVTRVYVQCYDGHLYMLTDNGESGTVEKLAETKNYSGVKYPNAYEQIAMDASGNLYCYNESGYLFCFTKADCAVPVIATDLSTERVKYAKDASAQALAVEASVSDEGTLSYQWQSSADKLTWTNIDGATETSYTPSTATEAATYYRCVVTNTKDGKTANTVSSIAHILVKVLSSNTTLNVMVNGSNSITAGTPAKPVVGSDGILYVENRGTAKVTNIWVGTMDEGTIDSFEVLQGIKAGKAQPKFTTIATNTDADGVVYLGRYYSSNYTLPIVAKTVVTAEDGVTKATYHIVIDADTADRYTVSVDGFTADNETLYTTETGITFTEAGQAVALTPVTSSIGSGEADAPAWTWTSSDVTVAKVDVNGVVTSVGGGTATITASYGQVTGTCTVTSTASQHTTHTYADGACSICGTTEPTALKAYFSLIGQDGKVAVSKDGTTDLYKTELSVNDADLDGTITLNDAFIVAHTTHSANGAADFVTEDSTYGAFITKLWGIANSSVGYYLNNASASGLSVELKKNDQITAYFYQDTIDYSDVYTYMSGQTTVAANNAATYTVSGVAGGNAVVPKGAAVKVYDSTKAEVAALATTVAEDGTFALTFADAGTYTVEVSGACSYTGSVWDYEMNDYTSKDFGAAPVITSRLTAEVLPAVSKTVYVSISTKSGSFAVNKNGDEMYRFPVTAADDAASPDGNVTIKEVLAAAHEQYHADGVSALAGHTNNFITKLWGESNGGNCSYYFNDVYMSGSGTKTGTNGRQWQDKLLNTVVEDGDSFYIYSFQATNWTKGDLYTYFAPVSESAIAGTAKTLTVKAGSGYGSNMLGTSLVRVTDSNGVEQTELNTTVGEDGTFTITFPAADTYTVDVRTNGTNYVTPARCTVHVSPAPSGSAPEDPVYISVVDPQGTTYLSKTSYTPEAGETAYSLLLRTGLNVVGSTDHQWGGVYVESIEGFGEFDDGNQSGWMYKVNGEFPECSASLYALNPGDYVEWVYTRELGSDIGGGAPAKGEEAPVSMPFTDIAEDYWAAEAIRTIYEKGLMNGISDTAFSPERTTSRGMIAAILYRLEGNPQVSGSQPFSDVAEGKYYSDAIIWAEASGIVGGYSDGTFAPNRAITREQMAAILYRYAKYKGYDVTAEADLSQFADADTIGAWSMEALEWANAMKLINGKKDNTLAPRGDATRAQVATILVRYLETIAK